MFAKIIPLTKLPRRFDYFDYFIPKEFETKIKIGHLVVVSFRNKKIYGVVQKLVQKTSVKNIKSLKSLTNIVLPKSLTQLAHWATNYYLTSPSLLYGLIIPRPIKQRKKTKNKIIPKTPSLTKMQSEKVIKILKNYTPHDNSFLYDENHKQTLAIFIKLIQKELGSKKQVLLLVPALSDILSFAPYLLNIFKNHLILWTAKLSKGEKFLKWQKINNGEPCIVLGTKSSCFLPFRKLSLTLIYNYNSQDHKQWDKNPRYDARKIINKLNTFHNTQIVTSDILPDLQTFKNIKNKKSYVLNNYKQLRDTPLIDLRKEKSLFSFPLYKMIKKGLAKKERLILFLNRHEKDSFLVCNNCRHTFACSLCERPFVVDKNYFLCYHCNIKNPAKIECPKCKGVNLKTLRLGVQSFKKMVTKEFPDAKIEVVTKTNSDYNPDWNILITNDYFWKNLIFKIDTNNIYGIAIIDFDFYLIRPEFNQIETALMALHRFLQLAKTRSALIQTSNPENEIFGELKKIYKKELIERKEINYPPYFRMIKIICKAENEKDLEMESKKLYDELLRRGLHPLPPFEPFIKKRTKNYLKHIVLKESLDKDFSILRKLIPDKYQIDVDPISIY